MNVARRFGGETDVDVFVTVRGPAGENHRFPLQLRLGLRRISAALRDRIVSSGHTAVASSEMVAGRPAYYEVDFLARSRLMARTMGSRATSSSSLSQSADSMRAGDGSRSATLKNMTRTSVLPNALTSRTNPSGASTRSSSLPPSRPQGMAPSATDPRSRSLDASSINRQASLGPPSLTGPRRRSPDNSTSTSTAQPRSRLVSIPACQRSGRSRADRSDCTGKQAIERRMVDLIDKARASAPRPIKTQPSALHGILLSPISLTVASYRTHSSSCSSHSHPTSP